MNIQRSPYTRPSKGTATERVWQLADEITLKQGFRARRKQVMDAYLLEGGNPNTASTQYHYWSQKQGTEEPAGETAAPTETSVIQLKVEPNGRLLIPMELRQLMHLGKSGRVAAKVVNGELRLVSPLVALRRLQKQAAELVEDTDSVVDEFIAEKREEAARE